MDRFFHSDWLGSTRYLSDNSGNNFPSALRYDAFGGRSLTGGSDPYDPTDFQFGGAWGYQTEYATATEPGVGLHYLQDRYYDPAIGRFVSADPLGIAGGVNVYQYVGNNPVGGVDPSGDAGLLDLLAFPLVGTPAAKEASDRYLAEHGSDYSGAGHFWAATKGFFGAFNPMNTVRELHDSAAGFGRALGCYESGHATGLDVALAGGEATVEVVGTALGIFSAGRGLGKSLAWLLERCFVAGTPVVMADGTTKPIEQVQVGDAVLARDEGSGKVEAKRVKQLFEREADGTVVLTFANGTQIETTETHPFYQDGRGFIAAGRLGVGTSIVTRAGPAVKLVKVERRTQRKKVYNFEVEDAHTYFVGQDGGGLWVHNGCDEWHHLFPLAEEFATQWKRLGIDPHDWTVELQKNFHQDWLHGLPRDGRGGWWNAQWRDFFAQNPRAELGEVMDQLQSMKEFWGIDNLEVKRYRWAGIFGR